MARYGVVIMMLALALAGCASDSDIFPDLGDNIAAPSAIWIDVPSQRLYVNNSNSKVLYDSTQGNFQIYNLANPGAPILLDTLQMPSFSGQLYVDTVNKVAWTPNRYSANAQATTSALYRIDIAEGSPTFLTMTGSEIFMNAFGMVCCYPANVAWIPNESTVSTQQALQYVNLEGGTASPNIQSIPLVTTLDNGSQITQTQTTYAAIVGSQLFLSRIYGGIMVVDLDKVVGGEAVPMDYYIQDIEVPYGLAADEAGNRLYVAGSGNNASGDWTNYLLVFDVTKIPPRVGNTTTEIIDKELAGLMLAMIPVGNNPTEVALTHLPGSTTTQYAFVTNAGDDTVSVVDTNALAVKQTITVGDEPVTMAVYTNGSGVDQYLYVANIAADTFSVIDLSTLTVSAVFP